MKKINWLAFLTIAILTVLAFTAGVTTTYLLLEANQGPALDDEESATFAEFWNVWRELQLHHYFFDEDVDLARGAIEGMIAATGDAYTSFHTLSEFENAMSHLRESFYGIGAEVNVINGDITISPMAGSPAENHGVLPGDVVISVDGEDVTGEDVGAVIDRIRGEYETVVTLGILRGTDAIHLEITRGRILNETVTFDTFEANGKTIGFVRVSTFGETTSRDFALAIDDLDQIGIDGLIIDMRNNAGGYLSAVNDMVSYLLPSGLPITAAIDRDGRGIVHSTTGSTTHRLDVEIVTLINGGSASASEIFAAAMIESGDFEVIGTTSFGKGTVQQARPISDNSMLQLTIQAWETPNGHLIEGSGVTPTIYVEASEFLQIVPVSLLDADVLVYDMVHPGVMSAQLILDTLGYFVNRTDGYFDSSTTLALQSFQADHELDPTGTIDRATATSLSMALRDRARDPVHDVQIQAAIDWFNQ